ncbi:MAG: NPCBM/NEW2 domain-containing protein [Phycisphaerae bacterium]|nr:NPCBM/NEW2 domain-containing protein [Phycisphaerae bacterium]
MNKKQEEFLLHQLMLSAIEGNISPEDFAILEQKLSNDPEAVEKYCELMITCSLVTKPGSVELDYCQQNNEINATSLFAEFIEKEYEQQAKITQIENPNSYFRAIEAVFGKRDSLPASSYQRKNISFSSIARVLGAIAAMVLIALILNWSGNLIKTDTHARKIPKQPIQLAKIVNSANTVWGEDCGKIGDNFELYNNRYHLRFGIVEIGFDNGAVVTIQAPCTFELESETQLYLASGNLSVNIGDNNDLGFIVRTAGATVVDYGTEFAVWANEAGETETCVFDGEVAIREGSDPVRTGKSIMLVAGQGASVDITGKASRSKFVANRFIRKIPDYQGIGVPGKIIDLADVVGGGNGYGSGQPDRYIDQRTGKLQRGFTGGNDHIVEKSNIFFPVFDLDFIDGVFVPDGGEGKPTISSDGHKFENCPDTCGQTIEDIFNGEVTGSWSSDGLLHELIYKGVKYGNQKHPSIAMHTNVGMTFDLEAIRRANPGSHIKAFRALCGISDQAISNSSKADFWVLVDGQQKFSIIEQKPMSNFRSIDILINSTDKYLTLITTDNDLSPSNDWCFFAKPVLILDSE